jgi:predicted nucleic acid-binding protein
LDTVAALKPTLRSRRGDSAGPALKLYVDGSALVKVLIAEAGSADVVQLWSEADEVLSVEIVALEARSAVARRLRGALAADARRQLSSRLNGMTILQLDGSLLASAASIAEKHRLPVLDAVHLAAALEAHDATLLFATWDGELRQAASRSGLTTAL